MNYPGPRYFKCLYEGKIFGRYTGLPTQAAKKAFGSIIKKFGYSDPIVFSIKECTRGSKKKMYTYEGERFKLDKPVTIQIGGMYNEKKLIQFNYSNKVFQREMIEKENKN